MLEKKLLFFYLLQWKAVRLNDRCGFFELREE